MKALYLGSIMIVQKCSCNIVYTNTKVPSSSGIRWMVFAEVWCFWVQCRSCVVM